MKNFIGRGNFTWFVGVVEDIHDPVQLGRVRVRCFGWHTEDKGQIPTDQLPWAIPVNPVTGASTSGVGDSPTGLVQGSWVIGFFIDGERAQEPAILGTIASIPRELADTEKGFYDPDGEFPRYTDDSDVNRLARGEQTKPYTPDSTIGEPDDPYNTEYPFNRVMETVSGHVKEFDDTPNAERIRELHKSGTFYQVNPDGTVITHIVQNRYTVISGDDSVHITGNVNIVVDGNLNISAPNGTINVESGDVIASGISLVNHTHTDTKGLGPGITSKPNS
jgi:hypothetical protein